MRGGRARNESKSVRHLDGKRSFPESVDEREFRMRFSGSG
jgi:hypothetical protein